jgi:hypothetical protein
MEVIESEMVRAIHGVFRGRIKRNQIRNLQNYEVASVALAIIWVVREGFLGKDGNLLYPLRPTLRRLVYEGADLPYTVTDLSQCFKRLNFYIGTVGRGSHNGPIKITVPSWLQPVLESLEVTEHVRLFIRQAEAASQAGEAQKLAEAEASADSIRARRLARKERSQKRALGLMLDRVEKRYGPQGLELLIECARKRLDGLDIQELPGLMWLKRVSLGHKHGAGEAQLHPWRFYVDLKCV